MQLAALFIVHRCSGARRHVSVCGGPACVHGCLRKKRYWCVLGLFILTVSVVNQRIGTRTVY